MFSDPLRQLDSSELVELEGIEPSTFPMAIGTLWFMLYQSVPVVARDRPDFSMTLAAIPFCVPRPVSRDFLGE